MCLHGVARGSFTFILPSTPTPVGLSLYFKFSNRIPSRMSHASHMPHPSHLFQIDQPIIFGEKYNFWNSPLCSFLQPPVTPSLSGSNILLGTLISKKNARKNSLAALFGGAQHSQCSSTLRMQNMNVRRNSIFRTKKLHPKNVQACIRMEQDRVHPCFM